ncbi:hypothetical protein [Sphingomonas aracearum]|uniref:Protein TonB n=1 Tax=Sphingomonas aracearum TaxID=2283317 RepID=A0A369VWR3_9SPHN|nr:hypothetical protein [Sphingomonas aracearum]RDE06824.1 hypothetical protein DVW87_03850 [Sphingomonas aracearum]
MRAATYRTSSYAARSSPRSRAASFVAAAGIVLLILLALFRLGGVLPDRFGEGRPLATFDVTPEGKSEKAAARQSPRVERARQQQAPAPRPVTPRETPPPLPVPPSQWVLPGVMKLSREEFAKTDIGRFPSKGDSKAGDALADAGGGTRDSDDDGSVGRGPNGQKLYPAQWYRRPPRSQTAPYMPAGKTGWGMIACRTVDRYHVEDCQELGETPGSGIARGLRQAAWQFLVRPPTVNGKPQVGAWVRIRFDLVEGPAE